ncbi:hypothetical protein SERLADRAFT_364516 [Serpula lacrymans var. lacrymans S7.9]|uniref:CxC2-like cysteine cluster KDZ transposase-associated domain-containing protein n=1 Tax=Serpula lacrymans var. lacrymans (strain S7.9) TaxID=578457 RepID=F8NEC6_SERL9|nr:uncharacterized protein SERLADRAFT_364516 [Serpula lacrymans var. lacrymans S7.9]EGO30560.1 hypothetical protein SERLADRAFT_364516 [Serpula lacrymans var. lacrymans S7.9]
MWLQYRSSMHHLPIRWYNCLNASCSDVQPLSNRLYPASQKKPHTVFTFSFLDDFLINNKECKTSAMTFYSKIWWMTNIAFPHKVPNRYQEFMRVSQQWRHLEYMHLDGFAHQPSCHPSLGSLALFCPACPQPDINVSLDWKQNPLRQYHLRTFFMDGNFNAEHMKSKNPHDDVPLANDTAFLTANQPYMEHLKIAKENKVGSTCNNHRAIDSVIVLYDIMCQYGRYFLKRVLESPYLQVPSGISLYKGIKLFHVHGHQDICFPRYAPNFIPGTGQVNEILDDHMSDSNWKKLI